ncbi:spiroplasma phage ORF1-like family protein [Spiroplasma poulsonii]|nr:DUF3688 family protein [Spiroplasma poulsonii]UNF62504.1 DUF3688 family protein [Spiroplasma poulsonii]
MNYRVISEMLQLRLNIDPWCKQVNELASGAGKTFQTIYSF